MGCGPSTDSGVHATKSNNQVTPTATKCETESAVLKTSTVSVRKNHQPLPKIAENPSKKKRDSNSNIDVPKPIAFDVSLDENETAEIIKKHPPKRLQRLAPIEGASKLTADMLIEKQKTAEEKRMNELEKVKELSRRSSRRRSQIEEARKFSLARQKTGIEEQQLTADKKREARLNEIKEKQRLREERAQRAREKAKRISMMADEDADIEVEKDTEFNQDDDVDSWLDDENLDESEPTYNNNKDKENKVKSVDSGYYGTRGISASTNDNFDQQHPRKLPPINQTAAEPRCIDDFFDS
ncbi:uncharacterized protein LOC141911556 [Tubulanus polymorphus]|uniref:uncharacterized protein LOC141911556 n=1 Tax=Tubulanus polymorphus TaxID=672921 RepID=UPI003DA5267D